MAEPTYEDLRGAYINAEARADQLAERLGKADAELVATRRVAREAKEALARAEADVAEVAEARKWVADKTGVGGGTRPLSFLIASHEQMARERNAALKRIEGAPHAPFCLSFTVIEGPYPTHRSAPPQTMRPRQPPDPSLCNCWKRQVSP